jgi:hypothetical protein
MTLLLIAAPSSTLLAQQLSVSFTTSEYNGYNVSCFGKKDGAIDITVTGGVPPYTYSWSTGDSIEDLSGLPSGYYGFAVVDAAGTWERSSVTLKEPEALRVTVDPFKYPSGHHISCHQCYNGSITTTVENGVPPYAYQWNDGPTVADRSALGASSYKLEVTDANGCVEYGNEVVLVQPERNDWTMQGNTNTNPTTDFIGTADDKDVVFKSNGQERIRLGGSGSIKLLGDFQGPGPIFRDAEGGLRGGEWPVLEELEPNRCNMLASIPYWETRGNTFTDLCDDQVPILGTMDLRPQRIYTSGSQRMFLSEHGKVGIGTVPPDGPVQQYRLFVADGIATRDVLVKLGDWPDYVFKEGYHLMPLDELKAFLAKENHLPGIPSAADVAEQGGVEIGELQRKMLETIEQQALYILQLQEQLDVLERRLNDFVNTTR